MKREIADQLRAPFPDANVGKLPKVFCGACRSVAKNRKSCEQHGHTWRKCGTCKATLTSAHLHVDYVGHADVTDRLLQVDPDWSWEPMGLSDKGTPALDEGLGLWIRLTVGGHTHIGYGHPDGKTGGDAIKEAIGDAIRNAAMRFGVALDLWRKESPSVGDPTPKGQKQGDPEIVSLRQRIWSLAQVKGLPTAEEVEADFTEWSRGKEISKAGKAELAEYLDTLQRRSNASQP